MGFVLSSKWLSKWDEFFSTIEKRVSYACEKMCISSNVIRPQ